MQDFSKMSLSNVVLSESNFTRFFNVILQNFSINPKNDDGHQMLDNIENDKLNNGNTYFLLLFLCYTNINVR